MSGKPSVACLCLAMANLAVAAESSPDAAAKPARNVDGIRDNSFLVEEAYNQEPGVVQHIVNAYTSLDPIGDSGQRDWGIVFTQEWPLWSEMHQFSYTIPYIISEQPRRVANGIGDVLLNYRCQWWLKEESLTAIAPRFSMVLPTGKAEEGFGDESLGFQGNLPFSTALGDYWFMHLNAGLTWLPNAGSASGQDLTHFNLGASAIYAVHPRWNLVLEWVGVSRERSAGEGGGREFESVISPGLRHAINFASGSQLVLGLAAPIGVAGGVPDIGVFLYLSFEHRFLKSRSS